MLLLGHLGVRLVLVNVALEDVSARPENSFKPSPIHLDALEWSLALDDDDTGSTWLVHQQSNLAYNYTTALSVWLRPSALGIAFHRPCNQAYQAFWAL